jgi:quercetin dioxygenase-like cupin family protein
MTVRQPPLLDPDDPKSSEVIESGLAEALIPVPPPVDAGAAMRQRLVDRARASREDAHRFVNVRRDEGAWRPLAGGVRVKLLYDGAAARSVLVDIAAGGSLPTHRHHEHEECIVLRGNARLGDLVVREGDYHVAPAGSRHGRVSSRDGALLYLRGVPIGDPLEVARDLVTAWFPGRNVAPITVRSDEGAWTDFLPGVQTKALWDDGASRSLLVRLQPGARMPGYAHPVDEECLLLDGELFVGDTLLRAGDYQRAPAGTRAADTTTDVGALFYVHGGADRMASARR